MGKFEFILPAMGEGIIEATITRWFVREGDTVEEDEPLLEVATDKVDSEVPAPVSGVISRIIYHEGEIPKIGEVLALIENENITGEDPGEETRGKREEVLQAEKREEILPKRKKPVRTVPSKPDTDDRRITPFVRFLAKDRGIGPEELQFIKGTGLGGRITKADINTYIRGGRVYKPAPVTETERIPDNGMSAESKEGAMPLVGPGEEIVEMNRTRRLIAEHMVRSKRTSPHVTSMVEIDVTHLVRWREANKKKFLEKYGIKLTYTPVFVEAAVKALKQYPDMNISVSGNYIIRKKYIHIGVATALPGGDLIVPVIRDADERNFANIATELSGLAQRARAGKLKPVEIKGGTFTITNMGQYDNVSGTPIINQPEVAILAVGAIKKKPAVVTINNEQTIGIRDILILSLTYDHRVVDGALGGSFVKAIGDYLVNNLPDF